MGGLQRSVCSAMIAWAILLEGGCAEGTRAPPGRGAVDIDSGLGTGTGGVVGDPNDPGGGGSAALADGALADQRLDASGDGDGITGTLGDAGADTGNGLGDLPAPSFGGAYSTGDPVKCLMDTCYAGNPLAAGECACPNGFTPIGPIRFLDDRACPTDNPPFGWQATLACYAGTFSATDHDFGGAYHREGATCHVGNPMAAGECSCPAGSAAIEMTFDHSCWYDTTVGFCHNAAAPLTGFAGAYQSSDDTGLGTSGCVVPNPVTGDCSCPAATTDVAIRGIYAPGDNGCDDRDAGVGYLHVCHKQ